jgi:3-oxoacyl-[acyl-carrier protein] reductase/2-hydroxycyclohexanecarboxyl-CoA dehydrogenase
MSSRLKGKTAFFTGAGSGIGLTSSIRLANEGANVWISDRDRAILEEAKETALAQGVTLSTIQADSTKSDSMKKAIDYIFQESGRLDILVNNAGGSLQTPYHFLEETDEDWKRVLDLNIMGAVVASRYVLPYMQQQKSGRIINFGSKAGRFSSLIAGANYAAAKGAIASLTRQLAMEFGPDGITVNCICPGVVLTKRTTGLWESRRTPEERAKVLLEIPLRRHAVAEDISGVVAFFASDDAGFITGTTLDVNGGQGMA